MEEGQFGSLQHRLGGTGVEVESKGGLCQMASDEQDNAPYCRDEHTQHKELRVGHKLVEVYSWAPTDKLAVSEQSPRTLLK